MAGFNTCPHHPYHVLSHVWTRQMGPSGSGKTSLLNVLAQRVPRKSVSGSVFVDGSHLSKSFKRKMGFVFQAGGAVCVASCLSPSVMSAVTHRRVKRLARSGAATAPRWCCWSVLELRRHRGLDSHHYGGTAFLVIHGHTWFPF